MAVLRTGLACILLYFAGIAALSDEKRLIKSIVENYKRVGHLGRPVFNYNETVTVNMGMSLQQVLGINREQQTITTLVWLNMNWHDILLQWSPKDFGGVEAIRVHPEDIFVPGIAPYNDVPGESRLTSTLVLVTSDGSVLWVPPVKLTTTCGLPLELSEDFTCKIKMGSWTYDASKIDIRTISDTIGTSTYAAHPRYRLKETNARRNEVKYDCCPETYVDLVFSMSFTAGSL